MKSCIMALRHYLKKKMVLFYLYNENREINKIALEMHCDRSRFCKKKLNVSTKCISKVLIKDSRYKEEKEKIIIWLKI